MSESNVGAAPAIRFHTLGEAGSAARLRQACLLTEQAYLAGERILVWLADSAAQSTFDDLLWTFGDRAFVPHEALGADPALAAAPVMLHGGPMLDEKILAAGFTTLVMLRDEPREEALRFPQVIEVVDAEPASRNAGRARFRFYRERGHTPQHVEVTA